MTLWQQRRAWCIKFTDAMLAMVSFSVEERTNVEGLRDTFVAVDEEHFRRAVWPFIEQRWGDAVPKGLAGPWARGLQLVDVPRA